MNRLIHYPIKIPDNKHGPPGKKCSSEFSVLSSGFEACLAEGEGERRKETGERKPETGDRRSEKTCMNEVVCRRGSTFGIRGLVLRLESFSLVSFNPVSKPLWTLWPLWETKLIYN